MEPGPLFYLSAWAFAVVLSGTVLFFSHKIPFFRESVERKEHARTQIFPRGFRLGGFFLALIFLILLLLDTRLERTDAFVALCIGTASIIAFSLADDFTHISWPWHLAFQGLLGTLLFTSGMTLEIGHYFSSFSFLDELVLGGFLLALIWMVLVMNALNWADGIDGLMPGVAVISFGTLFLLSLRPEVNQPTVALLSIVLSGLALSLLLFNWFPARILAGTGGAYFFGFTLAVLGLYAGMKIATLFLVLIVPVIDALLVIVRRFVRGHSLFAPDHEHLHHLLQGWGWTASQISFAYLSVTSLMALFALSLEGERKLIFFIGIGLLIVFFSLLLHLSLASKKSSAL